MTESEALALCIRVMKNVTYCFDSIEGDVLHEKHPSCMTLLKSVIKKAEHEEYTD